MIPLDYPLILDHSLTLEKVDNPIRNTFSIAWKRSFAMRWAFEYPRSPPPFHNRQCTTLLYSDSLSWHGAHSTNPFPRQHHMSQVVGFQGPP